MVLKKEFKNLVKIKMKFKNQIEIKYLIIYSCLILNSNDARQFNCGNVGSNLNNGSSRSSLSSGSFRSSFSSSSGRTNGGSSVLTSTSFRSNNKSPSSHSFNTGSTSLPNKPVFSICEGKRALRLGSNVGHSSPSSNFKTKPLNKQADHSTISNTTANNGLNTRFKQPNFNTAAKLLTPAIDDANPTLSKHPPYNPFYKSETRPTIIDNSGVIKHTQEPAPNRFYNTGTNANSSPFSTVLQHLPSYYLYHQQHIISANKSSTILSDYLNGSTEIPSTSTNLSTLLANKSAKMRRREYTIPTIFQKNFTKPQQLRKGFQNGKPNYAKNQVIVMIILAVIIIIIITLIFYVKLKK